MSGRAVSTVVGLVLAVVLVTFSAAAVLVLATLAGAGRAVEAVRRLRPERRAAWVPTVGSTPRGSAVTGAR